MAELVSPLAAVLQALLDKERQLDALELAPEAPDRDRLDLWRKTNLQAISALEQAIAWLPASSLDEAAVQALIAEGTLNGLAEELPEAEVIGDRIETAARLIRSALPVIAMSAGIDLDQYGGRHYGHSAAPWPFPPDQLPEP
jgi:hypothetical protein